MFCSTLFSSADYSLLLSSNFPCFLKLSLLTHCTSNFDDLFSLISTYCLNRFYTYADCSIICTVYITKENVQLGKQNNFDNNVLSFENKFVIFTSDENTFQLTSIYSKISLTVNILKNYGWARLNTLYNQRPGKNKFDTVNNWTTFNITN